MFWHLACEGCRSRSGCADRCPGLPLQACSAAALGVWFVCAPGWEGGTAAPLMCACTSCRCHGVVTAADAAVAAAAWWWIGVALLQVEVSAGSNEHFQVWEGWVHSRMRLLIRNAGQYVEVRPWPKAFRPPAAPPEAAQEMEVDAGGQLEAGGQQQGGGQEQHCCFYYMGLSKKRQASYTYGQQLVIPQSKVDLTPAVNDFAHRVKDWDQRQPGMEIAVRHLVAKMLPTWLPRPGAPLAVAAAGQQQPPAADGKPPLPPNGTLVAAVPAASAAGAQLQQPVAAVGSKRQLPDATAAIAALKRQNTGSPKFAVAAAAVAAEGAAAAGTPVSRQTSELSMADLQQQTSEAAAGAPAGALAAAGAPETADTAEDKRTASAEAGLAAVGDVADALVLEQQENGMLAAPEAAEQRSVQQQQSVRRPMIAVK